MSILISHHSSFEKLPLTFKTQYWKKLINQTFPEDNFESLLHQGLMLPKVQYDTEQLYHYLRFEDQLLEQSDIPLLDEMIQSALDKKKYVFLDVDRFFIPVEENPVKYILSIRPLFMGNARVGGIHSN